MDIRRNLEKFRVITLTQSSEALINRQLRLSLMEQFNIHLQQTGL